MDIQLQTEQIHSLSFDKVVLKIVLNCFCLYKFVVYEDSIADLGEAVSLVNSTLSGQIQDVDTGLTALGDTVAELEGRMENLESELTSIVELINELEGRLTKLEVAGMFTCELSSS